MEFIPAKHRRALGQRQEHGRVSRRGGERDRDQWEQGKVVHGGGRGTGETIGVTGVEQSSKLGPMGDRERENILGKDHIGETGVVWASGPMGNRTGVC